MDKNVKKQTNKKPKPVVDEPRHTGGRTSTYTFEVSERICELMAQGRGPAGNLRSPRYAG
jgi:hypothetical protein